MSSDMGGILEAAIHETPFAIIDLETTGLSGDYDRIVELSVVRMEPGGEPQHVLDTLVNPHRPMAATEIHGITDEDVVGAPTFAEIAGDVVRAVSGCVVAAYNVYFDIKFLAAELGQVSVTQVPPHLCVMYLRPMLELGDRCRLPEACSLCGVSYAEHHAASSDAEAAARLMVQYLDRMRNIGIRTFGELAERRSYKFVDSFLNAPLDPSIVCNRERCATLKPRRPAVWGPALAGSATSGGLAIAVKPHALSDYWEVLKTTLADLTLSAAEICELKGLGAQLDEEQVRMLHARFFSAAIAQFILDQRVDGSEVKVLNRVHLALRELGWAPGDPLNPQAGTEGTDDVGSKPSKCAQPESGPGSAGLPLHGLIVVVTGTLQHYERDEVKNLIKRLGGKASSSVSSRTDFVLVGSSPGNKLAVAQALGVKTIGETEFRKMIGEA